MKVRPIKQRGSDACGPTSIELAVRYFGLPITVKKIAEVSQYKSKEGLSNVELVETLKLLGLNAKSKANASWEDLETLNTPENVLILSWMSRGYLGHFSVLEKIDKTHIYLADPTEGKIKKMQKNIFMRLWFDYDEMWYPEKNTDIQLRWMAIVSKK